MLALPLVFIDFKSDRISVGENRMLANRPSFSDIKKHPGMFIRQFDAWFKDSTGFREKLLALYKAVNENKWLNNVVQYTNGSHVYLIGENGHHYFAYTGGWMISKFQGRKFISDEQLLNMASKLDMVKTYLDSKGIPLVVMFCTDKESVYPEYYPKSIKRGPEPIQLDVITKYLQDHTSVDVFNIRQALLAEKNNYLLYHKIDTMAFTGNFAHYNEIGAFFAYRELMKHVNKYFPQIIPYTTDDIEISYDEKEIPHVALKSGFTYQRYDSSFFDNVNVYRPFTWQNRAYENISGLPVILVLCDSYAEEFYIGKYITQQFGKAILIYYASISNIQEYINQFKPDIVVFESAERELGSFANSVIGIPELP
jgi:hypothetical protein